MGRQERGRGQVAVRNTCLLWRQLLAKWTGFLWASNTPVTYTRCALVDSQMFPKS